MKIMTRNLAMALFAITDVLSPAQAAEPKPSGRGGSAQRNPSPAIRDVRGIASIVTFLASDDEVFITGQELVADGGMSLL